LPFVRSRVAASGLSHSIQQIEHDKNALPPSEKQIPKRQPAIFVQAGNLAIKNGALNAEMIGDPYGKFSKAVKRALRVVDDF
jgi:hypothetical protein